MPQVSAARPPGLTSAKATSSPNSTDKIVMFCGTGHFASAGHFSAGSITFRSPSISKTAALSCFDPSSRPLPRLANELTDTLVIEYHRDAGARYENRNATAKDKGFRMIDLKAISADQFNRKGLKWRAPLKGP